MIKELIRRRRAQMLIHSCIYYNFDSNLVSDDTWQTWANELAELQNNNPDDCNINFFDKEFVGWDGTTGHHLPLLDPWVIDKARYLMRYANL